MHSRRKEEDNLQRNEIQVISDFFKTLNAKDNEATYRTVGEKIVTNPHCSLCGRDQKIHPHILFPGKKMFEHIL